MLAPFFAQTPAGARLYLHHRAHSPSGEQLAPRGLVLYVHPFAEELNKTRRMAALQSRALAAAGFEVLQPDLMGCGDSDGHFQDCTWNAWLDDIAHAANWLRTQHPQAPLWLWGLRAGALLACEAAQHRAAQIGNCHLLLWQPATSGQAHLQQFLRLLTAGTLDHTPRPTQADLLTQLQCGQSLAVAGYTLPPALALGLAQATLQPHAALGPQRMVWLETNPREAPALMPASAPVLDAWAAQGWQVQAHAVQGPAFWQTTEIEVAPALIDATLQALLP